MERLTKNDNGTNIIAECRNELCKETCNRVSGCKECPIAKAIDRLAEYEEAEEQGLLLRLPFPIGKPIYKVCYATEINDGFVYETVMSLEFYADNIKDFENGIVYITKSDAEQALAEMKGV